MQTYMFIVGHGSSTTKSDKPNQVLGTSTSHLPSAGPTRSRAEFVRRLSLWIGFMLGLNLVDICTVNMKFLYVSVDRACAWFEFSWYMYC